MLFFRGGFVSQVFRGLMLIEGFQEVPMTLKLSRRRLLATGASMAAGAYANLAMPRVSRAADRPLITHGVQSGDVNVDGGVVWARADRPSEMMVEVSTTDTFSNVRVLPPVAALPETDFTAKLLLEQLPSGQDIFYRVRFRDLSHINIASEPMVGRFRTAPTDRRDVSFVWGGDVAGQGWGINPDDGGMFTFDTMRKHGPDFLIHSGDTIYADGVISGEVTLPDGKLWKNLTIPEKAKVAETLDEFRAAHKYNLLDRNVRAFNAEVPIFVQWDDHEVCNNWSLSKQLPDTYKERSITLLAARAARAFHQMYPMRESIVEPGRVYRTLNYGPHLDVFMLDERSYRGANGPNLQTSYGPDSYFIGPDQLAWLKRGLLDSRATWKVIASDMPLSLIVYDDAASKSGSEAFAQGDGPPRGRELEIADILRFIKASQIANTVWLTADVHYAAAHYYSPDKAQFQDFEPFWEFVSGPLHAGTYGPNELDNTFGPEVRFVKAPGADRQNLPPSDGMQFFGHVKIDGASGQMTVTLRDRADVALWSTTLDPKPAQL
jgi:alkaline phosphatase D